MLENTESTERQYALRQRAADLGWVADQIRVIDQDLGHSGASASDRAGFQELVAEVSLGHVGLVMGLEVSRLARNSADWHQLLELCALTDTLICDEDGLYDPHDFNDRLVLGLKGTMSEAELHVLKSRLQGGIESKARRGELKTPLPVGFVYTPDNGVVLDPDAAVQQAIHLLFDTFARTGSAWKTVQFFTTHAIPFPRRVHHGPHRGELVWGPLVHGRVREILHNPRYAGAFCFGRTHTRYTGDHKAHVESLPPSEWMALVHDAHPGYITWDRFEEIQRRLRDNAQTYDAENSAHPPREGLALIQGLVLCGRCGRRMTVRYHERQSGPVSDYVCQYEGIAEGQAICQSVPGQAIDAAIGELVVTIISPTVLQQALAVQEEYRQQMREVERLRQQEIDRARYEVHAAHRRYLLVDPANRLVAQSLETDWNTKLQILADLEATADRHHQEEPTLTPSQEAAIAALATDVPRLWADLATPQRERKRLVHLVIADVTLTRETEHILIQVRLHSGHTQTFRIPRPLTIGERRRTAASIVQQIDDLLNEGPETYVARVLNERGVRPVDGLCFTKGSVRHLREVNHLKSRRQRLRAQGWLTQNEVAAALHCGIATVKAWRRQGVLHAEAYNDHPEYLYAPLTYPIPSKGQWKRGWTAIPEVMTQTEKEV